MREGKRSNVRSSRKIKAFKQHVASRYGSSLRALVAGVEKCAVKSDRNAELYSALPTELIEKDATSDRGDHRHHHRARLAHRGLVRRHRHHRRLSAPFSGGLR